MYLFIYNTTSKICVVSSTTLLLRLHTQIKYVYTYKYIHTLSRYRHKRQTSVTCMSISLSYHDIRTSVFEPLSFLKNFSYSKNEQINAARAAAWIDTRRALRISILYSFPITKHEFWMSLPFSFLVDKTCFNMDLKTNNFYQKI